MCGGKPVDDRGMMADENRKCRDVGCCLIFIVFWIGMLVVGAIGIKFGQWQRLLYGTDYQGNTCGINGLSGSPYITYPRTNEDFVLNLQKTDPLTYTFYGVCVAQCPTTLTVICNYGTAGSQR